MNGGRSKWEKEGRPLTKEVPSFPRTNYKAKEPDASIRAFRDEVFKHIEARNALVDVRSPKEYSGELLHMPNYPQEGATRGGHIPGAANIPWAQATKKKTELLNRLKSCEIYMKTKALHQIRKLSLTAGSGREAPTPGLFSNTCLDIQK
jgi:thiosulfate/3-mercaptopyruvate sulfurtransferase